VIVWVHGGAWLGGSKDRCPALSFLRDGFAVASVNYRLSQHALFPAQIEDCKAAVRWLRAQATTYMLDPDRIGVWGASAGGHLVALLGTTGDVKEFDTGGHLAHSSRVQAVCDFFGPTDFTRMSQFPSTMDHDAPDRLVRGPPLRPGRERSGQVQACPADSGLQVHSSPTVVRYLTPSGTGTATGTVVASVPAVRRLVSTATKAV